MEKNKTLEDGRKPCRVTRHAMQMRLKPKSSMLKYDLACRLLST